MARRFVPVVVALLTLGLTAPALGSPPQDHSPGVRLSQSSAADSFLTSIEPISDTEWRESHSSVWAWEWDGEAYAGLYEEVFRCSEAECQQVRTRMGMGAISADDFTTGLREAHLDTVLIIDTFDADWNLLSSRRRAVRADWVANDIPRPDHVSQYASLGDCWAVAGAWAGATVWHDATASVGNRSLGDGPGYTTEGVDAAAYFDCYSL